jgi:hypothetical protein
MLVGVSKKVFPKRVNLGARKPGWKENQEMEATFAVRIREQDVVSLSDQFFGQIYHEGRVVAPAFVIISMLVEVEP